MPVKISYSFIGEGKKNSSITVVIKNTFHRGDREITSNNIISKFYGDIIKYDLSRAHTF